MRAGPKSHFFFGCRAGWSDAQLDRLRIDECGSLRLREAPGSGRPLVDASGSFGGLVHPASIALDSDDRTYILNAGRHEIRRFDPCKCEFSTLPCIGGEGQEPRQLRRPSAIGIRGGDLYIVDTGNARIQVFSLKGLALRSMWQQRDWEPHGIAWSGCGTAYVTDRGGNQLVVFDRHGCAKRTISGFDRPTHIAADRNGIYIVERERNRVAVLDAQTGEIRYIESAETIRGAFCPVAVAVDESGNIYISDRVQSCVWRFCTDECGAARFAGRCRTLDGQGLLLAFDSAGNPLTLKSGQVVEFDADALFETEGVFISAALDSQIWRCHWDRVRLHGDVPPGTFVRIETVTADSEKSDEEIAALPATRWSTGQVCSSIGKGDWDCLIRSTNGRYLWLKLTLTSDGQQSPVLQRAKVHYPRASSIRFLPATYQEDSSSADFLDRFLSIFDSLRDGIVDRIAQMAHLFDPMATPPGFLPWLASWMGLALERQWPIEKRRRLLANAYRLWKLRGTPEGLRLHVELYTGATPQILEHFKLRRWLYLNSGRLGDQTRIWGFGIMKRLQLDVFSEIGSFQLLDGSDPEDDPVSYFAHVFTVFVTSRSYNDAIERQNVQRIVEAARPAHTEAIVNVLPPRLLIGNDSYVGLNTVISEYPEGVRSGESRLRYDAVLGLNDEEDDAPALRVGVRSRIGSSTLLE